MDDFEYSVHISDRDWECFFVECEGCDLLPPSLAGVDDSGMSDIDDTGTIHTDKVLKVDPTAGFLQPNCPIDGPPDCEGSPVDVHLSKHGFGGLENVLSGSEEDIHLQSVNTFFERLKSLSEAEKLIETSQVGAGENRARAQGEELCSDGHQASNSSGALPKNIPKLNSVAARSEAAIGKETTEPVATISNINTMKKDEPDSKISPRIAAKNSLPKTNKSAHPETEPFVRQQACTETAVNEVRRQSLSHESPDMDVCSGVTPHTDKRITSHMCMPLDDVKQGDLLMSQSINQVVEETGEDDQKSYFIHFDTDPKSTRDKSSQESFPSASSKKKRRRKKRTSTELNESEHGYKRNVSVKQSDSEDEYTWMGRIDPCSSVDNNFSCINETEKIDPTYLAIRNLQLKTAARDNKVNDLSYYIPQSDLQESVVRQRTCKVPGSPQSTTGKDRSATPTSPTNDSVMSNNCGNVATDLQPHSKLQTEKSAIPSVYPGLPVSYSDCVSGKSGLATETGNCEREDVHAGSLRQSDTINHSLTCWEIEQNPKSCTAEVISVTRRVLQSAESNDPAVEDSQNEVSPAKSLLAVQDGNSGRNNHTLCQREAEHSQQLEIVYHRTQQCSSTFDNTISHLSATVMITSDVQELPANNNTIQQSKTRPCSPYERLTEVVCGKLMLDTSDSSPDTTTTTSERSVIKVHHSESSLQSGEVICTITGNSEGEIQPVTQLSNQNITDTAGNSCSSVCPSHFGGQGLAVNEEQDEGAAGFKSLAVLRDTAESKCDLTGGAEAGVTATLAEREQEESPHSVFAMSSFWSEMEKLTINDILGLRMIRDADTPSSLSPLLETEMPDMFTDTDSGFFNQLDEAKPEEIAEDTSTVPDLVESVSGTVLTSDDPTTLRGVTWENESDPVTLGDVEMMLTPVCDIPVPVLAGSPQSVRQISKNLSVRNLHALDSAPFSSMWKGQAAELDKECFTDGHMPRQDSGVDSLPSSSFTGNASTDSYRISLTDIFKYFFGQKESTPSQSATENLTSYYIYGNSVPETYDHFFSEFDTESLFSNPLSKGEPVPIFSSPRSTNRNLQFPEAYDYFFASSSSDNSSTESDEEEDCGPVRVVSRFSPKTNASQISTDIYENFFTDSDLRQNLFWKSTFSFRNVHFMRSLSQKQSSNTLSLQPVRQLSRDPQSVIPTISEPLQEPLLFHLEDRISRQLTQQCFIRYEDLQTAVSNPRLDASFLTLRQSDMCLVCIAFASWVLKSANPQIGDAWKAVLLANVSALSAIRYLRKYKRVEAAAGEKELHHAAPES